MAKLSPKLKMSRFYAQYLGLCILACLLYMASLQLLHFVRFSVCLSVRQTLLLLVF